MWMRCCWWDVTGWGDIVDKMLLMRFCWRDVIDKMLLMRCCWWDVVDEMLLMRCCWWNIVLDKLLVMKCFCRAAMDKNYRNVVSILEDEYDAGVVPRRVICGIIFVCTNIVHSLRKKLNMNIDLRMHLVW